MSRQEIQGDAQSELFIAPSAWPQGFAYEDEVIAADDETALMARFDELPFKPFEFYAFRGNRHVVSFGWRYDYSGATLRRSDEIPAFLFPLRELAAAFAGIAADTLQQVLINKYAPGAGIGWHRDRPVYEDVVAISLGAPCTLRLRRKQGDGWERASQRILPRSAYLLRGVVRREWEHSVPPVDRLRYSATFRNFVAGSIK
jgi:alkylated DNA repair dioxygenase AlkB